MKEYLAHYGIKGMRWGVRRTPEQLGRLKDTYRSKARTVSDHYQRAIDGVSNSREADSKRHKRHHEGVAAYQYDKALKYEKQMRSIERKLKRKGVAIQRTPKQAALQREAASLFVKKNMGRRVAEFTITEVQIGVQFAARMALPDLPWSQYVFATGYSGYKVKNQKA